MTLDPSAIREDGTDERTQGVVVRGLRSRLAGGGQGGPGDPPTVGLILVQQPRGEDKKKARCWDYHWLEVREIDVEVQVNQQGYILVLSRKARTRRESELGSLLSHRRPWRDHFGSVRGGGSGRRGKTRK